MEGFINHTREFMDDFEPKFIDYFMSLSLLYNSDNSNKISKEVVQFIYRDIFDEQPSLFDTQNNLFNEICENSEKIGFILSKSMFYFLENYIKSVKSNKFNYYEKLIICMKNYIEMLDNKCHSCPLKLGIVNFRNNKNFVFGTNILDIFQNIKNLGEEVTFFNLYEGVPVSTKAKVVTIDKNEVSFGVEKIQELAMRADSTAYILKDRNFEKHVKADIFYHDFSNNTIVLGNFMYLLNMPTIKREFIRVIPNILAEVHLRGDKNLVINGKLFDLSLNGLGVIAEVNNGLLIGAEINVSFSLPSYEENKIDTIETAGTVLDIIEYGDSYRYCIHVNPDAQAEEKIVRYVKNREQEIIESLNKKLNSYEI
jgi:hypothetical protein